MEVVKDFEEGRIYNELTDSYQNGLFDAWKNVIEEDWKEGLETFTWSYHLQIENSALVQSRKSI